jgi:hypothetical protein
MSRIDWIVGTMLGSFDEIDCMREAMLALEVPNEKTRVEGELIFGSMIDRFNNIGVRLGRQHVAQLPSASGASCFSVSDPCPVVGALAYDLPVRVPSTCRQA